MGEFILSDETFAIVGAAMEVYYKVGIGFLEPIYQECLEIELTKRKIPFESQKKLSFYYKDIKLRKEYIPDFFCYGQAIVELKVLDRLTNIEVAQILNYLKITKMRVGILINFGSVPKLEWKKYVL